MIVNQGKNIEVINNDANNLTPILANKILECINFSINREAVINNLVFELDDLGISYLDNAPVCVSSIIYSYDSIGVQNDSINSRYSCKEFNMNGQNPTIISDGAASYNLYEKYLGYTSLNCCVSNQSINTQKFIEESLELIIDNLNVTVEGTIGGEPFIGHYNYTGSLV